ncbi:MAG: hypothetical protein ACYDHW_01750 [Syntrophorhabdaceae bacterium]
MIFKIHGVPTINEGIAVDAPSGSVGQPSKRLKEEKNKWSLHLQVFSMVSLRTLARWRM